MWEAKADRMLLPGICHSLRGDFSWPKMGILKWPLTTPYLLVLLYLEEPASTPL